MHYKKTLVAFLFISFLFNCKNQKNTITEALIIPQPLEQTNNKGVFVINSSTGINYSEDFRVSATFLKTFIEDGSAIKLQNNNSISFIKDESILEPEGYTLEIFPNKIEIKALTDQGAFYAVQSLRQILPETFENGTFTEESITLPCLKINDNPQFKYRGMHLDVGRHLFPVEFIKKYIDALAMLKMNTFHWHLTDDQGWRIEIKKYPKLQEIAAYRNETLIGHYNTQPQQFDGKKYGGFYTQDQIKAIIAYAQERFVTVIPEIELPGHSQAAIASYPELGCTGAQVEVAKKGGVFENIFCPKEETFTFLEGVFNEVIALFPSKYIHIGGDEAPKTHWKNCKSCQALMKKEGLKDEHQLQSYFITRIEKHLNSKGRQIIGWDEILEGGLAPNATVMSWRGFDGAIQAAKQHHNVILTPNSHCYFDYYQSENKDEPLAIGGFLPLEKVYSLNPIPEALTIEESKYVLGAQGNLWTEYIPSSKKVEYMVFPRILALSEVVWSHPKQKNYINFVSRVEQFHKRLKALDINYANHLFEIEGELLSIENKIMYQLQTVSKGKTIRFTLDESEPTQNSEIYKLPIPITESITIKARVFDDHKKLGTTFSQNINLHKAVGKPITSNTPLNPSYSGSGFQGLINGISGSNSRYGDKEWLGFWGEDLEITIDLGVETEVSSITTRFFNGNGQWIYAPKHMSITYDNNETSKIEIPNSGALIIPVKSTNVSKTRFIKLTIPNYGTIPEGNQGSGHKAWTFIDEITIN